MRFKVEIPWPYDAAAAEAQRLIEAGTGTIVDQNVLDELLDLLEDCSAVFVVPGKAGGTRELDVNAVRDLRDQVGFAFWAEG